MFAQKAVELVQELERAKDFLPPFNVSDNNSSDKESEDLRLFSFRKTVSVRF